MGINVSTAMNFENRDSLRNTAKEILLKNGASQKKATDTLYNAIFADSDSVSTTELNIIKASTQISLNKSLKETLKYLQAHANDKRKKYVLGDLWNKFDKGEKDNYQGELIDFELDDTLTNIFAA